jgi:hypothetical protein
MKKTLNLIVLLFVIVWSATTVSAKTYKIGCIDDYYPYISTNNNGELEGIVIDWWNLWSEKSGVKIEFIGLDVQACIDKTKTGEIDAISGLFYSDERAEYLDFSEPLMRMKTILFLRNDIKVDSLKNFTGVVHVIENSLAQSFMLKNHPQLKQNAHKSYASLIKAIYLQNVDGVVYDIPNPIGNYKVTSSPKGYYPYETLFAEKLRPAVNKGNSQLANLIISGAGKISDEELAEIVNKWKLFEKDDSQMRWFLGVGLLFLLVIIILVVYVVKNKRKVKNLVEHGSKTDWQVIIDKGENDRIEFKSSLRWDYRQEKVNKALEMVVLKTISAFLNTDGGMLFIGVNDDGNTLGLDHDYKSMSKNSPDGFLLTLTNLINQNMGKSTHKFISINIISINEKDVCIVNIEKSDNPVFLGKNEKEEFYIRASASSQPLGLSESYKYILSHWQK